MPLKTISEINQIFYEQIAAPSPCGHKAEKPQISVFRVVSDILFYLAIVVILYSVLSVEVGEGETRSIMGYSYFTVMSSSMKDEIPKGSLIIVRQTDPSKLEIGDNITFKREGGVTVTHKIIDKYDSYSNVSMKEFRTKGVNNVNMDPYTVSESDVLGKVILVLPRVGALITGVCENIHIILIIFLLCTLLSFLLRGIDKKGGSRQHEQF